VRPGLQPVARVVGEIRRRHQRSPRQVARACQAGELIEVKVVVSCSK
jgi:hypothetical protein